MNNLKKRPAWMGPECSTVWPTVSVSTLLQFRRCPLLGIWRQQHATVKAREDLSMYIGLAVHEALGASPEKRHRIINRQMNNVKGMFGPDVAAQATSSCINMVSWASNQLALRGYRLSTEKIFRRPHQGSHLILQSQMDGFCIEGDGTPVVVEYKTGKQLGDKLNAEVNRQTMFSCWTALGESDAVRRIVLSLREKVVYTDLLRAPVLESFVARQSNLLKSYARAIAAPEEVKGRPGNYCNFCAFAGRCADSGTRFSQ